MGQKTLFRVLVRVAGVWMIANGLSELARAAARLTQGILNDDTLEHLWTWPVAALGTVMLSCGLYCFFGSRHLAGLAFRNNHVFCHNCGWELTNVTEDGCPECGAVCVEVQEIVDG